MNNPFEGFGREELADSLITFTYDRPEYVGYSMTWGFYQYVEIAMEKIRKAPTDEQAQKIMAESVLPLDRAQEFLDDLVELYHKYGFEADRNHLSILDQGIVLGVLEGERHDREQTL